MIENSIVLPGFDYVAPRVIWVKPEIGAEYQIEIVQKEKEPRIR